MSLEQDEKWMSLAVGLAEQAAAVGEVPVGAIIVDTNKQQVLGSGFNQPIQTHDPTAHAEIMALRAAAQARRNYRLPSTTLYVTLEPCAMCAGAINHARIDRVVVATPEPRAGACGSQLTVLNHPALNHRCDVVFGVLRERSAQLLKSFFAEKRK